MSKVEIEDLVSALSEELMFFKAIYDAVRICTESEESYILDLGFCF